ncbi:DDB1- and CUL4-associated factor 8-like [Clytia hemisphaerica]|uniref:Uncharacterized protein n=1 Tax=Clytia hemisphaerica TaxID=252671 RepID=A0A7M5XB70_9CNID
MKVYHRQKDWHGVQSIFSSSLGLTEQFIYRNAAKKSRTFVSRLSLSNTLNFHEGCVNAVNFSHSGDFIASGSDDLKICIWDWNNNHNNQPLLAFDSGHHGNVFQTKFMAHTNDTVVVSCARDGEIRVSYLSSAKDKNQITKKILQHKGSAHKLSVSKSSPHLLKSAGEDGVVYNIDLRDTTTPQKLLTVRNTKGGKIALYSIDTNPLNDHEFAVSGRDPFARIYDERMLSEENNGLLDSYCADHLKAPEEKNFNPPNITCLMYNYNGTELLCSYNDEEIYLFDIKDSSQKDFTHVYKGHRNSDTVKGVNFFGPRSEYIVSGSDCGHVFLWDKETEEIVNFMKGDEGVVNVLEPHPTSCILATSGLEHNIKIWSPVGQSFKSNEELDKQVRENAAAREEDRKHGGGRDLFYLMMMMRRMRRQRQRQRRRAERLAEEQQGDGERTTSTEGEGEDETTDEVDSDVELSSTDEDEDDEDDDEDSTPMCAQS